jgi:hypothetical protein
LSFGIFLLLWTGLNAYVVSRLLSVPLIAHHVPRYALIALVIAIAASYLAARLVQRYRIGRLPYWVECVGAQWIGIAFLLFVPFIVLDFAAGFGLFFNASAGRPRSDALICGVALVLIALVQARRAPAVTEYEFTLPDLPRAADGTVLLAVSDLHLGPALGHRWALALADQLAALRPDLLLLIGDIFEDEAASYAGWLPVLQRLQAPHGVFMVTGNHERYAGGEKVLELMQRAGFCLLRDRSAEPIPGLVICGAEDAAFRPRGRLHHARAVTRLLAERPAGATVLLSHRPVATELAAHAGVRLMVCGHTHDGQIWPFNYVARLAFRLMAGCYDIAGMPVIVGRGTGVWGPRMRLWRRGEILRITLRCASSAA